MHGAAGGSTGTGGSHAGTRRPSDPLVLFVRHDQRPAENAFVDPLQHRVLLALFFFVEVVAFVGAQLVFQISTGSDERRACRAECIRDVLLDHDG